MPRWIVLPLVGAGLMLSWAVSGAEPLPKDIVNEEGVLLRLDQVEMDQVVDLYSRITDKVVLPAPELKGKITIINRHRIKAAEAARLIESALELQGWTAIPQGKVVKLVKSKDAVKRMVPTVTPHADSELRNVSRMQTHLVPLRYATGEDVKSLITPLLSNDGTIQHNQRTNLLVITEVGTNMSRLLELIETVDRPLNTEEEFFDSVQLLHVAPKKMVEDIKDYFKNATVNFLPNERLGVLVLNGKRQEVERARQVIAQLDRQVDPSQTVNEIIHMKYAKATEVAELVSKLYKSRIDPPPPSFSVNSDKASNTLLVTGPAELRSEIARLVKEIDQRYDQVLLKVLVGEVDTSPTRSLGIQWSYLRNATNLAQDIGAMNTSQQATDTRTGTLGLRYSVIHPLGYSHFVHALETSKSFSLLASPQIAVATNKTATFKVTDQVPVQTAERMSDNSNTTVRSNEFKEVGLTLKATPSITPNHEVSLDMDFEYSETTGRDPVFQNPRFTKRQATTTVIVADEHSVVIAGLMKRKHDRDEKRIPWLGRMPVIGPLFRERSDGNQRQELLVLLTPSIMHSLKEADRIAAKARANVLSSTGSSAFRKSLQEISGFVADTSKLSKEQRDALQEGESVPVDMTERLHQDGIVGPAPAERQAPASLPEMAPIPPPLEPAGPTGTPAERSAAPPVESLIAPSGDRARLAAGVVESEPGVFTIARSSPPQERAAPAPAASPAAPVSPVVAASPSVRQAPVKAQEQAPKERRSAWSFLGFGRGKKEPPVVKPPEAAAATPVAQSTPIASLAQTRIVPPAPTGSVVGQDSGEGAAALRQLEEKIRERRASRQALIAKLRERTRTAPLAAGPETATLGAAPQIHDRATYENPDMTRPRPASAPAAQPTAAAAKPPATRASPKARPDVAAGKARPSPGPELKAKIAEFLQLIQTQDARINGISRLAAGALAGDDE